MTKVPKALSEDQIKFWLANTSLTRDELLKWYESFEKESNEKSKLDKDSFKKTITSLKIKGNDPVLGDCLFSAFDQDDSGTIDFHEFIIGFNIIGHGSLQSKLEWMFDVYDSNGDKTIDRKEMGVILRAILKTGNKKLVGDQTTESKIDELFEKLDENDNQKISKDEFVNSCSNNVFVRNVLMADFIKE